MYIYVRTINKYGLPDNNGGRLSSHGLSLVAFGFPSGRTRHPANPVCPAARLPARPSASLPARRVPDPIEHENASLSAH